MYAYLHPFYACNQVAASTAPLATGLQVDKTITNPNSRNYMSLRRKLLPEAKIWFGLVEWRKTLPPPSRVCPCVCPSFRPCQSCRSKWRKRDFTRLSRPWSNWSTRTCQGSLITGEHFISGIWKLGARNQSTSMYKYFYLYCLFTLIRCTYG